MEEIRISIYSVKDILVFDECIEIAKDESIRSRVIELADNLEIYPSGRVDVNSPIKITLNNMTNKDYSLGIPYRIDDDKSIYFMQMYTPLYYDWTFKDFVSLYSAGVIDGDVNHLIIYFPSGLGSPPALLESLTEIDWMNFFSAVNVLIKLPKILNFFAVYFYKMNNRKVRRIYKEFKKCNIKYPREVRLFFENKDEWSTRDIKTLLNIKYDEDVYLLMKSLGYELKGNEWSISRKIRLRLKRRLWTLGEERRCL